MDGSLRERLEGLDGNTLGALVGRSLFLSWEYSKPELDAVCSVTEILQGMDRAGIATPLFPNQLNLALFFDSSTRTKSSWAGAAARLGAAPIIFDGSSTQVAHGETSAETGAMLGMNAHALGVRHDLILGEGNRFIREAHRGITEYLRSVGDERVVPMVNLQCDIDHPTQTLADLCWLRERFPEGLHGKKVAVSWAYSPSYAKPLSVPQGLINLLPRFGADVTLAHPEGYALMPECLASAAELAAEGGGSLTVTDDMDAAVAGADIVYPKSWGPYDLMLERVAANRAGDTGRLADIEKAALKRNRLFTDWIYDERRERLTAKGSALYMHCLPADIGAEVSPGVMERFKVDVAREANKKVYVIMSLLALAKEPSLRERLLALLQAAGR